VSQVPAELIVFQGQPNFIPITGTGLLWAENTTADVLVNTANNDYCFECLGHRPRGKFSVEDCDGHRRARGCWRPTHGHGLRCADWATQELYLKRSVWRPLRRRRRKCLPKQRQRLATTHFTGGGNPPQATPLGPIANNRRAAATRIAPAAGTAVAATALPAAGVVVTATISAVVVGEIVLAAAVSPAVSVAAALVAAALVAEDFVAVADARVATTPADAGACSSTTRSARTDRPPLIEAARVADRTLYVQLFSYPRGDNHDLQRQTTLTVSFGSGTGWLLQEETRLFCSKLLYHP
jgi:hypothetical protein